MQDGINIANRIFKGFSHYNHINLGITIDGTYHPPNSDTALAWHNPLIEEPEENPPQGGGSSGSGTR